MVDTTRVLSLSEIDDDHIAQALDVPATTRGRYFAGNDADGAKIFKAKQGPLRPATVSNN